MGAGAAGAPDAWIWVRLGPLAGQSLLEHFAGLVRGWQRSLAAECQVDRPQTGPRRVADPSSVEGLFVGRSDGGWGVFGPYFVDADAMISKDSPESHAFKES